MDSTTQIQNEVKTDGQPGGAAKLIRQVRQATKRRLSTEDKIRIVLEGFRKEIAVTDLCRRERISPAVYYAWLKQFMEAGKAQLRHDTLRGATNDGIAPPVYCRIILIPLQLHCQFHWHILDKQSVVLNPPSSLFLYPYQVRI